MAISDVLHEALEQIEEYMQPPFDYERMQVEMDWLTSQMRAMLRFLDTPPRGGRPGVDLREVGWQGPVSDNREERSAMREPGVRTKAAE